MQTRAGKGQQAMTLPARINHPAALAHARRVIASKLSPVSPAVRLARAYVDLHEKTKGVLVAVLEKVDAAIAEGGGQ